MTLTCENCEAVATTVVRYAGITTERCESCAYSLIADGLYTDAEIIEELT